MTGTDYESGVRAAGAVAFACDRSAGRVRFTGDVSRFGLVETEPPKRYEGRVQLSDLTAEDREHVLRLLFAKINAVHGSVQPRPEHTMAADGTFLTTPMVALPSAPPPPT